MLKGFKVVGLRSDTTLGRLTSWSYQFALPLNARPYWRGKWRRRQTGWGPLAIFDTLENAILFVEEYAGKGERVLIYRAEFEPSQDTYLWIKDGATFRNLPTGTMLADRVKLTTIAKAVQR